MDTTFSYAAVGLACFSLKLGCVLCVSARAWFLWSVAICSSARVTDSCFVHWILYPSHRTDFRYPFDYLRSIHPVRIGGTCDVGHCDCCHITKALQFECSQLRWRKRVAVQNVATCLTPNIYIYIYLYLLFLFIFLAFFSVSVCCLIRSTYSSLCSCCFFANLCFAFHAGS